MFIRQDTQKEHNKVEVEKRNDDSMTIANKKIFSLLASVLNDINFNFQA